VETQKVQDGSYQLAFDNYLSDYLRVYPTLNLLSMVGSSLCLLWSHRSEGAWFLLEQADSKMFHGETDITPRQLLESWRWFWGGVLSITLIANGEFGSTHDGNGGSGSDTGKVAEPLWLRTLHMLVIAGPVIFVGGIQLGFEVCYFRMANDDPVSVPSRIVVVLTCISMFFFGGLGKFQVGGYTWGSSGHVDVGARAEWSIITFASIFGILPMMPLLKKVIEKHNENNTSEA